MNSHVSLPADAGTLQIVKDNGVGHITFGHPKSNSLPSALLKALAETINETASDSEVHVLLLRSEGERAFCAGASFSELVSLKNNEEAKEFFSGFARVIDALVGAPQLTVAGVQGKAVGGGVGLIAACDYAIASPAASIKLSELAIGIGPFVIGKAVIQKIGFAAFGAMSIDTEWREADWSLQQGLFSRVVDSNEVISNVAISFAENLAKRSPVALRALKKFLQTQQEVSIDSMLELADVSGTLSQQSECQEILQAALSKSR